VVHRTVRWVISARAEVHRRRTRCSREKEKVSRLKFTGLFGEPKALAANGRLRNQRATRGPRQRSVRHTGLSGAPTSPKARWSVAPDMEGDHAPDCYSSCPVHHSTEGKNCLPSWSPTAPSCLRAIKGIPRRMEQNTKHSRSILRLLDSASTHLIHRVSDLSSVRVVNSLCCVLSSSFG
jgi:hypothetical protein